MKIKDLYDCEYEKHIKIITSDFDKASNLEVIPREIRASDYDLDSAKRDFGFSDNKWATIKAYYSILHATNAFVRIKGVIINHHFCTYLFLEKLANKGEIETRYVLAFRATLNDRMDANYGEIFNKDIAENAIKTAEDYNKKIKEMMSVKSVPEIRKDTYP
jgi:uncharacterized protein (UPF0332 family)